MNHVNLKRMFQNYFPSFIVFKAVALMGLWLAPSLALAGGYDKPYIGETGIYKAKYEDTLVHVARDHNLGFVEMRAANPDVDPWLPGEGTELILPLRHILPDAPHEGIVINLPEMRLYAFVNGDKPPVTYPIGVGREGLDTPVGQTKIVRKTEGPVWRPTKRMRKEDPELPEMIEPGPENPLGTHALYLGWPLYAIHGTNRPFGIGRRVSSGCIRLYPEGITKLYEQIPVGTKVTVVNQPVKLAWIDDVLYMEAHPDIEQAIQMEENGLVSRQKLTDEDMRQIMKAAGAHKGRLHWAAIRTAIRNRRGTPVVIARRPATVVPEKSAQKAEAAPEKTAQETTQKAQDALEEIYKNGEEEKETALYSGEGRKRILNP